MILLEDFRTQLVSQKAFITARINERRIAATGTFHRR
jgi:hypothetical protein